MESENDRMETSRLNEAVVEYLLAQDRGEFIDPADLAARFPDVADELQDYLRVERRLSAKSRAVEPESAASGPEGVAVLPTVENLAPEFTDPELINRGGMGIIYKAREVRFDRTVALKFILLGRWASDADHSRFRVEAQALGRLKHPAIVQVYSSGEIDGNPYLVMEFIDGRSLRQLIEETPLSATAAARITMQVARAVAEAHRNQILHRDLKPSNILIDHRQQPHVTDFGLAKVLDNQHDVTVAGQIVGTPSYASPEQVQADAEVGAASDIYSLGAVLYACLTGRPPFRTDSMAQTVLMVQEVDPPPPRLFAPLLPRDLETICLKCLEKKPQSRYDSASALADDLQRFLDRDPILARPVSLMERTWRWIRRNRAMATGVLFVVFAAAGLAVHSSVVSQLNDRLFDRNERLEQALLTSSQLRQLERETSLRSQQLSYASDMRLALEAWHAGDSRQVAELLETHFPPNSGTDVRCFVWRYLSRVIPRPVAEWAHLDTACYHVAFSPNGTHSLVSCGDGLIRIFESSSGRLLQQLNTQQVEVNSVTFRSDGTMLASAGDDGTVRLWTWPELQPVATVDVFDGRPVFGVAFNRDGNTLFTCGDSNAVKVFDVERRTLTKTLDGPHERRIEAVAVSPDGRYLATAGRDHIAAVWDAESLQLDQRIEFHTDGLTTVAFAADSIHLVSGAMDGNVLVWNVPLRRRVARLIRPDPIQQVAISSGGLIAIADRGGSVSLVSPHLQPSDNTQLLEPMAKWQADSRRIYGVAFAPNQRQLITASMSGRVTAWTTNVPQPALQLGERSDATDTTTGAVVALTDSEIAVCGPQALTRHNLTTGESSVLASTDDCFISCDARTENVTGREVVVAVELPNILHVIPSDRAADKLTIGSAVDQIREVRLLPGFDQAVIRRTSGMLSKIDVSSGTVIEDLGRCNALTLADRTGVLWLGERGTGNGLISIDLDSGRRQLYPDAHRSTIRAIAVSPDETKIVSTGNDRSLALWDAATGELIKRFESLPENGISIDWSPDGRAIAVGSDTDKLHLFQTDTLREMGVLFTGDDSICSVRFTADGQWLIAVDAWLQAWALDGRPPGGHVTPDVAFDEDKANSAE